VAISLQSLPASQQFGKYLVRALPGFSICSPVPVAALRALPGCSLDSPDPVWQGKIGVNNGDDVGDGA
jgi:hypothetical protein